MGLSVYRDINKLSMERVKLDFFGICFMLLVRASSRNSRMGVQIWDEINQLLDIKVQYHSFTL